MSTQTTISSSADMICFSHLRWGFVFQRPQHLMSRFARDRRVFFFEEPEYREVMQPQIHTSVCPKTGQPDFGTIRLTYVPDKLCVELKSYKFYLQSFRTCGIFYEDVTNRILDDLVKALKPRSMTITTEWTPRGGLHSIITAEYQAKPRRA